MLWNDFIASTGLKNVVDKNELVSLEQKKPNRRSMLLSHFVLWVKLPSLAFAAKLRIRQMLSEIQADPPKAYSSFRIFAKVILSHLFWKTRSTDLPYSKASLTLK